MKLSPKIVSLGLSLAVVALAGCQLADTKTKDTRTVPREWYGQEQLKPIEINEKTVFLDARPAFEYGLSHVPGSIRVGWEEFTDGGSQRSGILIKDLSKATKRLALLGIDKDTPVLVIGKGRDGDGEAGRLAWTLHYLGVKNVQVVHIAYFKSKLTQSETEPRANVPEWKYELREEELIPFDEMKKFIVARKPHDDKKVQLIDVRTQEEYFAKSKDGSAYLTPEMPTINISWQEFIDPMGRPDPAIVDKLKSVGFGPNDRVLLISNKGARSAATLMALKELGYKNVAHFNGGYNELIPKIVPKKITGSKSGSKRAK